MMRKQLVVSPLITLIAAAIGLFLWESQTLDRIEGVTWDWRARTFQAPSPQADKIKLILIDQKSLDWVEANLGPSWPWPRELYNAFIKYCFQGRAEAVVIDMLYTEASRVKDDKIFATVLAEYPSVYIAALLSSNQDNTPTWPTSFRGLLPIHGDAHAIPDPICGNSWMLPVETIGNAAIINNVGTRPDPDGVIRRLPLFSCFEDKAIPLLGAAPLVHQGEPPTIHYSSQDRAWMIHEKNYFLDADGHLILNFRDRAHSYERLSAAAVIQSFFQHLEGKTPNIPAEHFKDTIVFLGTSAPGLMDLKTTPVADRVPGVEIHATLLDNLLTDDYLRQVSLFIHGLFILLTTGGAVLAILRTRSLAQGLINASLAIIIPTSLAFIAYRLGYWLPLSPAIISILCGLLIAQAYNYATEGKQRQFIKNTFQHYLSPAVIEQLLEHPERLDLGGEYKELTIFFSDLQGFSTISERMDPRDLTALLNDYLTEMTDIILDEGGTIDKYEGDAIIAFWNAPIDQEDHAARGCRAVMRCQERLAELQDKYRPQAGCDLVMRIGMHSGKAVVGNMGSKRRFDYTMLGDTVNLAARLEGANKFFNTHTMLSEATVNPVRDLFTFREIGPIRVVGRKTPVLTYTPAAPELAETYNQALDLFKQQRFEEAYTRFMELAPNDPLSAFYAEQTKRFQETLPADWEGVWNLTSK